MLRQAEADRHHAGWRRVVRHRLPVTGRLQRFGADFRTHQQIGEVLAEPAALAQGGGIAVSPAPAAAIVGVVKT
jgi:hypothetical protein